MSDFNPKTILFKPTFFQNLLGRHYKWFFITIFAFKSNTTYRYNSLMWLASSMIILLGTILVWYINYTNQVNFETNFKSIFTYFIIGESLIFSTAIQFDIGENIQDGKLITKLLRPTDCLLFYVAHAFGYQLFENTAKMAIYLIFGLIFQQYLLWPSWFNFLSFLGLVVIAYIINTLIGILVGLTAFWLTAFYGSASFFDSCKLILSGKFFPLSSLKILQFTLFAPFAFTFYHPMQIYLGKYNLEQTIWVFIGGLVWCIVLYFLAKVVFKMGLKKNESVGL